MIARLIWLRGPLVVAASLLASGCEGEPAKAGDPCEVDEDCPAELECLYKTCTDGPFIRFCSKKCEGGGDCPGFSQPYCEYLGGLGRSCIEKGSNPCASSP